MQGYTSPSITEVGSVRELTLRATFARDYDGYYFHTSSQVATS